MYISEKKLIKYLTEELGLKVDDDYVTFLENPFKDSDELDLIDRNELREVLEIIEYETYDFDDFEINDTQKLLLNIIFANREKISVPIMKAKEVLEELGLTVKTKYDDTMLILYNFKLTDEEVEAIAKRDTIPFTTVEKQLVISIYNDLIKNYNEKRTEDNRKCTV